MKEILFDTSRKTDAPEADLSIAVEGIATR